MLYLSLASCLRRSAGMQGMKQPKRQHKMPDLFRFSAFLYTRQGSQQVPHRHIEQSPQQLHNPCFHSAGLVQVLRIPIHQ